MGGTSNILQAGVIGASGYTGGELVRLLAHHPRVRIRALTAARNAGPGSAGSAQSTGKAGPPKRVKSAAQYSIASSRWTARMERPEPCASPPSSESTSAGR